MPSVPLTEQQIAAIPAVLRQRQQWVCWKIEERDGKPTKVPYNATTGERARSDSPPTWCSFEEAVAAVADGIGFMFSAEDPFVGVDLDGCRNPTTGELQLWAARRVDRFATYTEISPSGTGVHMIGQGSWLNSWHKKRIAGSTSNGDKSPALEVYDRLRYFTVTGLPLERTMSEVTDCREALRELGEEFASPAPDSQPRRPRQIEVEDTELLEIARSAANGDRFRRLFDDGDTSAYGGDDSAADLALCNHLAFYCGRAQSRMDRLFRSSALYREKWDERRGETTYGQMTLDKAVTSCTEVYHPTSIREVIQAAVEPASLNGNSPGKFSGMDGRALMNTEFPAIRWVLKDLIPEGLTVFGGPSKSCKSWLCVEIIVAVASEGIVLGNVHAERGEVLYLALEDSYRRLKGRFTTVLRGDPMPAGITLDIQCPKVGVGCEEYLQEWIDHHPHGRLIVIDVLQRIRPPKQPGVSEYEQDYMILERIQSLALRNRVGIVVVTHTRKLPSEDPFDKISGSVGIQGVADTILALSRIRGEKDAILNYTGREVGTESLALQWDELNCGWICLGPAKEHRMSAERTAILEFLLTCDQAVGPSEIAAATGKNNTSIRYLLGQMVSFNVIKRAGRGEYYMTEMQKESHRHR